MNLNVFQVMDSGAFGLTNIYALHTTVTNIAQLFTPQTSIVVRDYDTVGTPQDGALSVMQSPIPRAVETPADLGVEQMNLSVPLRFNSVVIV